MKKIETWFDIPEDSDFTIYNLPYGIFSTKKNPKKRIGMAIGEYVLDLNILQNLGFLDALGLNKNIFVADSLNGFIGLGRSKTKRVRSTVQNLLKKKNQDLKGRKNVFLKQSEVQMHLPVEVGDYTDFYSSIEHATNVGIMFRDPKNALMPNWKHIPVGYHGRSSSIVISGTPIHRPKGQVMPLSAKTPVYQATSRLDMELEMAFIIGKNTRLGETIPVDKANDYIFGMVLFNDWSARDIQKWEYVPLGPFLGKNFASSVSPWVVTMEALEFFRVQGPRQDPKPLPYLRSKGKQNIDVRLEVGLTPKGGEENIICRSNYKYMYWNQAQQLAHHTVNGCNIRIGDMMASGTISGKDPDSYGSMLELAWAGTKPLKLSDGSTRVFFQDHDTVTLRGRCEKDGIRVGFGEVNAKILPAVK